MRYFPLYRVLGFLKVIHGVIGKETSVVLLVSLIHIGSSILLALYQTKQMLNKRIPPHDLIANFTKCPQF